MVAHVLPYDGRLIMLMSVDIKNYSPICQVINFIPYGFHRLRGEAGLTVVFQAAARTSAARSNRSTCSGVPASL
jgi:hypothetical protein